MRGYTGTPLLIIIIYLLSLLLLLSCAALCLRTCAPSSSDIFYFIVRGFVLTDLRTLTLPSDKYFLCARLCVYGLAHTCTPFLIIFLCARLCFTDLRTLAHLF